MSGWRDLAEGEITSHLTITCDGRNPGDHPEGFIITWWRDSRREWQWWAGRVPYDEVSSPQRSGARMTAAPGGLVPSDLARARCRRCGLDVQAYRSRWLAMLSRAAGAGITSRRLRDVPRMLALPLSARARPIACG